MLFAGEIGVPGPADAGNGIWLALVAEEYDSTGFTTGLGRPKAPPKAGAGAPKAGFGAPNEGDELMLADPGVGSEDACFGSPRPELAWVDGWKEDEGRVERRSDSVRSDGSDVSSCCCQLVLLTSP